MVLHCRWIKSHCRLIKWCSEKLLLFFNVCLFLILFCDLSPFWTVAQTYWKHFWVVPGVLLQLSTKILQLFHFATCTFNTYMHSVKFEEFLVLCEGVESITANFVRLWECAMKAKTATRITIKKSTVNIYLVAVTSKHFPTHTPLRTYCSSFLYLLTLVNRLARQNSGLFNFTLTY